jgi:GcrA cell cycle regulator
MSVIEPEFSSPKPAAKAAKPSAKTWTDDRLALLKEGFDAGLTCREIADSLGLSRNAVIGKLSRLALTRDRPEGAPREKSDAAKPRRARLFGPPRLVRALRAAPQPQDGEPIHQANGCSFMELTAEQCRWPLTTPTELRFCGNPRAEGLSYCPGHARLAYRAGSSRRAS